MLKIGDKDAKGLYYGSSAVAKAFLGSTQVWPSLPYDAEVQWLQSIRGVSQWIDTGIKCSQVYGVFIRYKITSWTSYGVVFNSYINESTNVVRIISQSSNNERGWANVNSRAGSSMAIPLSLNTWYNYKANLSSNVLRAEINGVSQSQSVPNGNTNNSNVILFGNLSPQVAQFTLYDLNGDALIDFIPVRFTNENGQSEGAMYDKVSKQLFRNKGTYNFIVGPDIKSSTRMLIDVTTSLNPTDKYWIYPEISSSVLDTQPTGRQLKPALDIQANFKGQVAMER